MIIGLWTSLAGRRWRQAGRTGADLNNSVKVQRALLRSPKALILLDLSKNPRNLECSDPRLALMSPAVIM